MRILFGLALLALSVEATAQNALVDPFEATIETDDVERFAALWHSSGESPTVEQIDEFYLEKAGAAVEAFTPYRIIDATNLQKAINANPAIYADAINKCLPWVDGLGSELRSIYFAYRGLLPERGLPRIALVVGANNSGGTIGNGYQVLGLEVICRLNPTRGDFNAAMRHFFAHETAHTLQWANFESRNADQLLFDTLHEGVADFLSLQVSGAIPHPERDAWAKKRETWVWKEFLRDLETVRSDVNDAGKLGPAGENAHSRWIANAGRAPEGWPDELGYWVGMRIAEAYVESSPDPNIAIRELLGFSDPAEILRRSGYSPTSE